MSIRDQSLRAKIIRKITGLIGEAPLDKASQQRANRHDAEVANVLVPMELLQD